MTPPEELSAGASRDDGGVEVGPGVYVPAEALVFQFARSGGPGGQNVNKLNTKAELWVDPGALRGMHPEAVERLKKSAGRRLTKEGMLHLTAETARTQESNRAAVMEKLRELIVGAMHRPKVRRPSKPTRGSRERRLAAKKRRGEIKAQRRGE